MASSARIEELKKKFDENPRRYFAPLANEYRKSGDLEAAIAICRTHLPQQPGHMSGHIVFGQTLFEAGKLEEAQGIFQTALELDPENLIALRHLGDIARGLGDDASARTWYTRVLEADPRNGEISGLLASLNANGERRPSGTAELEPPAVEAASPSLGGGHTQVLDPSAWARELAEPEAAPEVGSPAQPSGGEVEEIPADTDSWAVPSRPDPVPEPDSPTPRGERDEGAASQRVSGESILPPPPDASGVTNLDGFEATEFQAPVSADAPPVLPGLEGMSDWATAETPPDGPASQSQGDVEPMSAPPAQDAQPDPLASPSFEFQPPDSAPLQAPPAEGRPDAGHDPSAPAGGVPFATETMAELLLSQGHRQQAVGVYRQLVEQRPGDDVLRSRLAELEAAGGPSMRQFLGALAAWRPGQADAAPGAIPADGSAGVAADEPDAVGQAGEPGDSTGFGSPLGEPVSARPAEQLAADDAEDSLEASDESSDDQPLPWLEPPAEEPPPPAPARSSGPFVVDESYVPPEVQRPPTNGAEGSAAQAPRGGSIDRLFGGKQPSERDVRAAHALAAAFGSAPTTPELAADEDGAIKGEPARRASSELSLDQIFRAGGGNARPGDAKSGFSFDQFFGSGGGGGSAPEKREPEAGSPETDDIQQFNSWLQGLKKR